MPASSAHDEVLVLAPTGRDGQLICQVLRNAGVACREFSSPQEVARELSAGAGAAVLAEEALTEAAVRVLSESLRDQPPWSDFPVIVLTAGGESTYVSKKSIAIREPLGNLTLIERPVRTETLVSSVRAALRARSRQYEIRDYLEERKTKEEELRRSHEQFRQLADAMPQLAWMAEPDGNIYWYNQRWYEYTGTTLEEMKGWGWQSVHDPEVLPRVMKQWQVSIRSGESFEMEFPLRGADGIFRWFLTRGTPVRDKQGRLVQWFGTNTNIHEQREARRALQEGQARLEGIVQQRTAALRQLSSRVLRSQDDERRRIARELHDSLGQYLAAMGMHVGALKSAPPESLPSLLTEAQDLLQRCVKECRTISHLLHPPLLDEMGLESAVRWYVEGFSQRSGIEVKLHVAKLQRMPLEIETAFFRVLQESLTNIHRHAGTKRAVVNLYPADERVVLEVRDHGRGIPAGVLERFRVSGEGVGVGLAGMRERLSELNGDLEISSSTSGTTVFVSLPVTAEFTKSANLRVSDQPQTQ